MHRAATLASVYANGAKQVNHLNLSRWTISVCVAAILFAGCGGSLNTPNPVNAAMPGAVRATPGNGGAFSANYSGTYKIVKSRGFGHYTIKVDGSGTASFLGPSRESGKMDAHCSMGCSANGVVTLRSTRHPRAAISMQFAFGSLGPGCPQYAVQYTVSRGKGRFYGASGSGTVTFSCSGSNTYSDQ
jgi:hypothetical protein